MHQMALSERERAILDLERSWWAGPDPHPSKDAAARACLGLSRSRFNALLGQLIESPDAEAYDPLLVRRLRRDRAARRRVRFEGPRVEGRGR